MKLSGTLGSQPVGHTFAEIRQHFQEIARGEIARHRRLLSILAPAQKSAAEGLLISTSDRILGCVIEHIRDCPEDVQQKFTGPWNSRE